MNLRDKFHNSRDRNANSPPKTPLTSMGRTNLPVSIIICPLKIFSFSSYELYKTLLPKNRLHIAIPRTITAQTTQLRIINPWKVGKASVCLIRVELINLPLL